MPARTGCALRRRVGHCGGPISKPEIENLALHGEESFGLVWSCRLARALSSSWELALFTDRSVIESSGKKITLRYSSAILMTASGLISTRALTEACQWLDISASASSSR